MTEKAFKTMGNAGAANLAIGITLIVVGIASGVVLIISGARLFKEKRGLTF
ncbi:hypothetical protein ABXS75_05755 [Roseburia hominis]